MNASVPTDNRVLASLQALRSPANIGLGVTSGVIMLLLLAGAARMVAADHSTLLALLVAVLALLIGLAGFCAISLRQLQTSRGISPSRFVEALTAGFAAAIKVALSMALLLAGVLVLLLVAGLLFLITQIPGIGPALNFVIFPLVALILGATLYAWGWIALPLTCVCACDGRSVLGSVATVMLVVRGRLLDVALRGILVALVSWLVVALAFYIVTLGVVTSQGVQGIVHVSSSHSAYGDMAGYGSMYGQAMGGLPGPLALVASAGVASLILYFLAISVGFVVYASGWVTIFNDCAGELDPAALEAQMRSQAGRVQRKAREAQARAAQMGKDHTAKSSQTSGLDADPTPPADPARDP